MRKKHTQPTMARRCGPTKKFHDNIKDDDNIENNKPRNV
jgi:hypothetical protein